MNKFITLFGLLLIANYAAAVVIPFSGDAYADYSEKIEFVSSTEVVGDEDPDYYWFPDPHNSIETEFDVFPWPNEIQDVGTPDGISVNSGWDIRSVYMSLDRASDLLQVAIDCYTVCGDADGDGDQGAAGEVLESNGGFDYTDLINSETFSLLLDTDNLEDDATFVPTLVIGWPANIGEVSEFGVYNFNPNSKFSPPNGYLGQLAVDNVGVLYPQSVNSYVDIEFSITPFTDLPGYELFSPSSSAIPIKFSIFSGSFEDDGVGEDFIPNNGSPLYHEFGGCIEDDCGLCPSDLGYGFGRDECDLCPADPQYNDALDDCNVCFGPGTDVCGYCEDHPGHNLGEDTCGLCYDDVGYGVSYNSDCDECFSLGLDECNLCPGEDGYGSSEDVCGTCFGPGRDECGLCFFEDGYESSVDNCGVCFGPGQDDCGVCEGEEGYETSKDVCDVCFGPGTDECGHCPTSPFHNSQDCYGCDDVPNSGLVYNRCGMCGVGDEYCPCYFDTYKGYQVWDLDRILTYYNTYVVLWDVIELKETLEVSLDLIYEYVWDEAFYGVQPIDFGYYCELVATFHVDCVIDFVDTWSFFISLL